MRIVSDFYNQPVLAAAFFRTQQQVFPWLDLRWYWQHNQLSRYTKPYAWCDGHDTLSILNVTEMSVQHRGETFKTTQLGTVATLPEFRNQGLCRRLLQQVIKDYQTKVDCMFLFANQSVLDFYPKYDFQPIEESGWRYPIQSVSNDFQPLDLSIQDNQKLLVELIKNHQPVSHLFEVSNSEDIRHFYCRKIFNEHVYINTAKDTILVAIKEKAKLIVLDVLSTQPLPAVFDNFSWPGCRYMDLCFMGDQVGDGASIDRMTNQDDQLMVLVFNRSANKLFSSPVRLPALIKT